MDKLGEGVKPSESGVSRRGFIRRALGAATAVLVGGVAGVGAGKEAEAPSLPKPQATRQTGIAQEVNNVTQVRPAPLAEGRSEANDHASWGIQVGERSSAKLDSSKVNSPNTQSILPSEADPVIGMTYDQIRALPNDDPMKEELLKQFSPQIANKP